MEKEEEEAGERIRQQYYHSTTKKPEFRSTVQKPQKPAKMTFSKDAEVVQSEEVVKPDSEYH